MKYLIGTDVGTSGTKSVLMDTNGQLIAQSLVEYDVLTPKPLWAEQWAQVWLDATIKSIKMVIDQSGVNPTDINGLGVSALYGGSGVPVDADGKEVRPTLIWMDRRAENEVAWVKANLDLDRLSHITGNDVVDPYYGYTKMLWIKANEPENWAKIKQLLPPDTFIVQHLTGQTAVNHSAAGNIGGVYDINQHTWSDEMLNALGIPRTMMPDRLVDATQIVGTITDEAATATGLAAGTPVIVGGVDVGAANVGMGVLEPGRFVAAIGTSMNAALVSEKPIKGKGLIVWPYPYHSEHLNYNFSGSATAGAITKWFRDNFGEMEVAQQHDGGKNAYAALSEAAKDIPAGSNGLVVLPYFMGERAPIWNSDAKGVIFGLSLAHNKLDVYHAFQEAVAYALRHSIELMDQDLGDYIILAGGVTQSPEWVQMFADVTGYAIRTPIENAEANLGDVMLAGLATDTLTVDDVQSWQVLGPKVEPDSAKHAIYNQYFELYRKLYDDLSDDMSTLTKLI
ncbi:xylulokinase [Weissella uvarum]|uniref:FGGY-family carbohydrate kinase n=1 Tax=Weissella uvarum TaxID=1479233 RepID=UPI0019602B95|nr:FGGY-family carbohydrate kinase [Weissella uvarum]MBM7616714.1 xylulokinase [Weissella uvarum]MCM0594831.1 FGGY-family carbohydrate kinase [Weissella uvarum]